ncbi:hypothetical protein E4T56_gene15191 [Termitomyces sp. T112]|nr:hypothetical protein E4T56_gene15191 [Termitomyces sp. T112]KAH0587286.1 hypothetical protein H2248_006089 [Termitomyces sp. 'cryptogamus']KNZ73823.1 hypothetical protein J132_09464 [Termitomyces sp. J132]
MSIPTYIYKIVPSDLIVLPLPERLPLSSLDTRDGFIHLSTAKQLPGTLSRFFASETKIHILRIEYRKIERDIRWETSSKDNEPGDIGDDGVFPHLYNGGRLGSEEVQNVVTIKKEGEDWDIMKIKESPWLMD